MEQRNSVQGGWRIENVYGLEEIIENKKKLKKIVFTMDDMLRTRYLREMIKQCNEVIVDENQEKKIELLCEKDLGYNLQEVFPTKSDYIIESAIKEVLEQKKLRDFAKALKEVQSIIQKEIEINTRHLQDIDTYTRNKRRELMKLLEIILGEENIGKLKAETDKKYKLSLNNVEFFNYLLDTYESKEVIWNKKEGTIEKADEYFWYNVKKGVEGLVKNENMPIKGNDVKEIFSHKFCVPYLNFLEILERFEETVERLKKLTTSDKNNLRFFEEAGRLVDKCNDDLCRNALKLDDYKDKYLWSQLHLKERDNERQK